MIIASIVILLCIIGFYFLFIKQTGIQYHSPQGQFVIIIKKKQNLFSIVMPGTGGKGSTPVTVILKDKSGKTIGKSSDNPECSIFDGSIEIEWDMKNNKVWYGRGKMIDLKTGRVGC